MNSPPARPLAGIQPVKVLCLLTAVVVGVHLLVLQRSARTVEALAQTTAKSFTTRSIAPTPPLAPTPAPAVPSQAVKAAPPARTAARAAPARPPTTRPAQRGTFTDITTIGPTESLAQQAPAAIDLPVPGVADTLAAGGAPPQGSVTEAAPVSAAASSAAPPSPSSSSTSSLPATPAPKASASDAPTTATAPPPPPAINASFALPGSTRLKYNVVATKGSLNFNARSELLWQQDGSNYELRLEVSAFLLGSRVQTSTGRMTSAGLAPTRFADKVRSEVAAHFERDRQLVIFSANTPQIALVAGMQDQLSVFVQLAAIIAGAPAQYPAGTVLMFDTIGPRSAEKWVLTVGEAETLSLPGGALTALKVTRSPRGEYDQTLEFWLAPQLGYLPARIKLTEKNGDYADQVWRATENP